MVATDAANVSSPNSPTSRAARAVRREHARDVYCDDFDPKAGETSDAEYVACENCRGVLLEWGGGDD